MAQSDAQYWQTCLNALEANGLAHVAAFDPVHDGRFDLFSDLFKDDWGVRPTGYTARQVCEYMIDRPERGYWSEDEIVDLTQIEEDRLAWEAVESTLEDDDTIDPFDYVVAFRKNRPSRAQFLRAVLAGS